jgi:Tfp pilus assembly protein PilV
MQNGLSNNMKKNKSKISGLSILEALVSTAIVGIGFIAILQMTNFSAQSIDNSGDRTKANYLTEMIAEDVISSRDSLYGVKSDNSNIVFKDGWEAELNCENLSTDSGNTKNIYETQDIDAPSNKEAKWDAIFNKNRFLKCKSNNETKKLETFEICRWDGCAYKNDLVFDDPIYISRVEMLLNNGKKRKYLYFQSDYNIKTTTGGSEDSDSLD